MHDSTSFKGDIEASLNKHNSVVMYYYSTIGTIMSLNTETNLHLTYTYDITVWSLYVAIYLSLYNVHVDVSIFE